MVMECSLKWVDRAALIVQGVLGRWCERVSHLTGNGVAPRAIFILLHSANLPGPVSPPPSKLRKVFKTGTLSSDFVLRKSKKSYKARVESAKYS